MSYRANHSDEMRTWWRLSTWPSIFRLDPSSVLRGCLVAFSISLCSSLLLGQSTVRPPESHDFFESKIRPILVEHCYECHSANAKILQGGLRVDHRDGLMQGGANGPAVVPKEPTRGTLLKALRHQDFEMPPKKKLSDSVVADFEAWIAMGAPDPRTNDEPPKGSRSIDIEAGRKFWAFQPISAPRRPEVQHASWSIDPLDDFVLFDLERLGIRPVADADRYTWLRRVSIDLTGLPPTPSEIDTFVRDNSPHACEQVVDRLLNSRAFGERWARHWLDLTGYADMMGTSNNVFAEHAWRYRDYLIAAFNKDKPFDRFIREQIAGDLIPAPSPEERAENITATGFLMVGDVEIVEPDKAKLEADHVDTQVSKIGMAFLGMTLGCARCHDHKFDPIGLQDYYGMAGILRSSPSTHKIPFGVWSKLNETELPETVAQSEARQALERAHAEDLAAKKLERDRLANEKKEIDEQLKSLSLDSSRQKPPIASEERLVSTSATVLDRESLTKRRDELAELIRKLGAAIQHAEFFQSKVPKAFAMRDGDAPSDMPIYIRGNPYAPGSVVPRGALRVLSWEAFPSIPEGQSGRMQLADWLADPRNPLPARVMVNRLWQKLFGEGLVRSVDYFGARGEVPSHPELLDHLAMRFQQEGWSIKKMLRSMVLSRTYRMASVNDAQALQKDPDNRWLWRMNRQRLDSEALRDGLLAVSGELQPCEGGPGLVLEEVDNCGDLVQKGVNPPNYNHRKPRANQEFQRSIYLPVLRTQFGSHDRLRSYFDFINPAQIAGQRQQTVVPTQLLFVLNNELFRKRAKVLADRLIQSDSSDGMRLERLWLRVYCRPISSEEREEAVEFLANLKSQFEKRGTSPVESSLWQELCHSLLSSNEFLFRF